MRIPLIMNLEHRDPAYAHYVYRRRYVGPMSYGVFGLRHVSLRLIVKVSGWLRSRRSLCA